MELYSSNESYKLYQGNMIDMLGVIESNSIDSIITDPPYELNFMSKGWDNAGVSFQSDTWEKCYEVLKPGGYLLAFGGSRTFHRIACAIEDAGFEIRDTIMWLYGAGFPKSMNVGKQLEKRLEDEKTKQKTEHDLRLMWGRDLQKTKRDEKKQDEVLQSQLQEQSLQGTMYGEKSKESNLWREKSCLERWNNIQKTEGELQRCKVCEMSKRVFINGEERWICNGTQISDGKILREMFEQSGSCTSYRPQSEQQQDRKLNAIQEQCRTQESREVIEYWNKFGTALKPSFEPIIVARKPFKGSLVDNVIKNGVGGINIDECRVETNEDLTRNCLGRASARHEGYYRPCFEHAEKKVYGSTNGRFPANTILTYDETDFDEVCGGFPNTKSGIAVRHNSGGNTFGGNNKKPLMEDLGYNDSGSASRYFYCAKASKKDRDEGLPNKWLDNLELILYNNIGDELWKDKITIKEENKAKHLEDMEASLQKVIEEYGIQTKKDIDLNMLLYGKKSLEKYLKENKYTTKTEINSTTVSQILNLLTLYTTKENIQDAKLETENGTNHVEIVENTNQLEIIIKENQELVPGANNVVLKMLLKINEKEGRNEHCTVKPTSLMQYLVRLVTPNGGTILDPFNGSGSTGKAVMYENKERNKNYKYIGIELTEEYLPIAKARIEYVCKLAEEEKNEERQLSIYDV